MIITNEHKKLIEAARKRQSCKGNPPLVCEEASIHSRETYIPCAAPAVKFVLSERGKVVYPMCAGCASHNIRNRDCEDLGAIGE